MKMKKMKNESQYADMYGLIKSEVYSKLQPDEQDYTGAVEVIASIDPKLNLEPEYVASLVRMVLWSLASKANILMREAKEQAERVADGKEELGSLVNGLAEKKESMYRCALDLQRLDLKGDSDII
jgi:hypothetical protein